MTRGALLLLALVLALSLARPTPAQDADAEEEPSDVPGLVAEKALVWLKGEQRDDGSWGAPSGEPAVGDTALAILSYLGQGHTQRFGPHKRVLYRALTFLRRQQTPDGGIGYDPRRPQTLLDHAQATLALAEAYALTRDFLLKRPAERARDLLLAQGDPKGGWSRATDGKPDTLLTAWVALALKAIQAAELELPPAAFARVKAHFDAVTDAQRRVGGFPGGKAETGDLPLGNAMAYVARLSAGQAREELAPLLEPVLARPPAKGEGQGPCEYWYFATCGAFQAGGKTWRTWQAALEPALVGRQQEDGSWPAQGGSPIRVTALATLSIGLWARHQRLPRQPATGGGRSP